MNKRLDDALRHQMAFSYWDDALDLQKLFLSAWSEHENFTKTGRIKIVLNLVMACECALKAHVVLSNPEADPKDLLIKIRTAGHSTKNLVKLTKYMPDRNAYELITSLLEGIGVEVRYSLDATHTYFRTDETYDFYDRTISNPAWVSKVQELLVTLIDACQADLTGNVSLDWDIMLELEGAFNELMQRRR